MRLIDADLLKARLDKIEPRIFQEGYQKTAVKNDVSYTITGSMIDTPKTTNEKSKDAIVFGRIIVMLSAAAAIHIATIYLIVKIIKEII